MSSPTNPPLKTRTEALGYILGLIPCRAIATVIGVTGLTWAGVCAIKRAGRTLDSGHAAALLAVATAAFGLVALVASRRNS